MSRFPRGKRGLKYKLFSKVPDVCLSLPSREAWIEILAAFTLITSSVSLPSREAWIEIFAIEKWTKRQDSSLPSREAWIEIILKLRENC